MERWLISQLGLEQHQISLECIIAPESKEVLKEAQGHVQGSQEPAARAALGMMCENWSTKIDFCYKRQ